MSTTMAQALAERIRYQITSGEKVLKAAGSHCDAVFGNPQDVLCVRGNVSDVALTNHLWLLDAVTAGAVERALPPALQKPRPGSIEEAVAFLGPRDTYSAEQALSQLRQVNEQIAKLVEELPDAALDTPVDVTFYGRKTLRDVLFIIIEHGSLHIGQAWGILKGKGLAG
jgi:DinB superfamily